MLIGLLWLGIDITVDYCFNKWAGKQGQGGQLSDQALEWSRIHHFTQTIHPNQIKNTV